MQPRLHILLIAASVIVFLVVLELIRRGRLREEYSLIWLFSAAAVLILVVFRGSLGILAEIVQIDYAPSLVFLVGIGLLMVIQLFHATAISRLTSQNRDLAQKLGILELRLRDLASKGHPELQSGLDRLSGNYLRKFSQEVNAQLCLPDLIRRTLELTLEGVGGNSGSLMVFDEHHRLLEGAIIYGGEVTPGDLEVLGETVTQGLAGWVLENREPALVSNTKEDARWLKRSWDEMDNQSRSALSVPLETNDRVIGVLTLAQSEEGQFSEHDLTALMALATLVTLAGGKILENPADRVGAP